MYKPISRNTLNPKDDLKAVARIIGDAMKSSAIDRMSSQEIDVKASDVAMALYHEFLEGRKLFTDREIAEFYGLCDGTLRNMRSQKRGPAFVKLESGSVRYRIAFLEDWIEQNLHDPFVQTVQAERDRRLEHRRKNGIRR